MPPAQMPAATLSSLTLHALKPFGPGPGSQNILIGGRPALRAQIDSHACPLPGTPPHGGGVVAVGSSTVFFNNLPAVRALDQIIEVGASNLILTGVNTVLIG